MSTCISREGEYSEHKSDEHFCCQRCFGFDEEAALAHIEQQAAEIERLRATADARDDWQAEADRQREQIRNLHEVVDREQARLSAVERERDAAKAREQALRETVAGLADKIEAEGITCECGHYVGDDHNSLGCYAVVTYSPLVRCACALTDAQDEDRIVAEMIRRAALGVER